MTTDKNKVTVEERARSTGKTLQMLTTLQEENARLRQERDELVGIAKALVSAHEWAIANPDSPVSAGINYGHIAVYARAILSKHKPQ